MVSRIPIILNTYTKYVEAAKAIGYDDEWIRENIRLTAYPSELYSYWGESDHSYHPYQWLVF